MTFSFIQIADPQFGMYSKLSGIDNPAVDRMANLGLMVQRMPKAEGMDFETANHGKVIDAANRLRPAFVVTCGDMTNDQDDPFEEHAELMRVTAGLSDDIPMHWVSGNHDVRGQPTHESLARYRGMYGDDVYSFDHEDSHFVVLNSTVIKSSANVEDECERQLAFLEADLRTGERERQPPHGRVHPPPAVPRLPGGGQQLAGAAAGAQAADGRPVPRDRRHPRLLGTLAPQPPRLLRGPGGRGDERGRLPAWAPTRPGCGSCRSATRASGTGSSHSTTCPIASTWD